MAFVVAPEEDVGVFDGLAHLGPPHSQAAETAPDAGAVATDADRLAVCQLERLARKTFQGQRAENPGLCSGEQVFQPFTNGLFLVVHSDDDADVWMYFYLAPIAV